MQLIIAQEQESISPQTLLTFIFFSAALFSLSILLNQQLMLGESLHSAPVTPLSYIDADQQAAEYQTWSDPLNDEDESSYVADAFPFEKHIRRVATEQQVDESLIYAVAKAESSFRSGVQSHVGAVGLMQIIATAAGRDAYYRLYKKRFTPTVEQLKDPYTNLQLGSAYLKLLEEHHFGHINNADLKQMLVLAAYNWGPFNVKRNILAKNPPRTVEEMKWVLWMKAPRETYDYVNRVLKYQTQFSQFDTLLVAKGY